jgi:CheY-like chemotaxis protein
MNVREVKDMEAQLLTMTPAATAWVGAPGTGVNGPNHTVRVLVIDDNEVDREILARYLGSSWPFERELELHFADNGRVALEQMRATHFHLIFLDWHMPFAGGREVLRALRGNGVHIPVVVVSGLLREEIPFDLESFGAAFLSKDEINPASMHDAVAGALQYRPAARSASRSAELNCRAPRTVIQSAR